MNLLRLFVKGFLIGIANIIPGMSGGTLALVLGIYERLIGALRNIGSSTVKGFFKLFSFRKTAFTDFQAELKRIDFSFLLILGFGAVAAVLATSKLIVFLLDSHHDATYGFFLGLVLTSILVPVRMLNGFRWRELLILLIAVIFLVLAEELKKAAATTNSSAEVGLELSFVTYFLFFISGAIAISAMILPGVSGSFLMLAFGVYFPMVTAIKDFMEHIPIILKGEVNLQILNNIMILGIFAVGCLFGMLAFTRLLNFLLDRYRNLTIAFLIGLMIGSLYGLWPFRSYVMVGNDRYDTTHLLPAIDMNLLITACVFLVGCAIILGFSRLEKETG